MIEDVIINMHVVTFAPSPKKNDALISLPMPLDRYAGEMTELCAFGYRHAAKVLLKNMQSGDETLLFFPLMFLYRHHIELMLKKLIYACDDVSVRRSTQIEPLTSKQREALRRGKKAHSLKCLWDRVRPALVKIGAISDELLKGLNFYIQQLDEIDPEAVDYRYPNEKTKEKLREKQKEGIHVSVQRFAEAMEGLAADLDGIDTYVAETYGACY